MNEVLFVCTGNAARSQFGQVLYEAKHGKGSAISAGTEVIEGKPIPSDVIKVLSEHGLEYEELFRKQLSKNLFETGSKVILMTDKSIPSYVVGDKIIRWQVQDPRSLGLNAHEEAFKSISTQVDEL